MGIFNEDNFLNAALLKIWDIILANLLFLLCSIPLVTIGPALTALYHCTLRTVKGNNQGTLKTFFHAFKSNFKYSLLVWLGSLILFFILYNNLMFLRGMAGSFAAVLYYMTIFLVIFLLMITTYIYPVIAAFEGDLKTLLKDAVLFAYLHIFKTIKMLLVWILPCLLTYFDTQFQPLYVFCWFFFLFGTLAYINSFTLYKLFLPYLGEDETDNTASCYDDGGNYLP